MDAPVLCETLPTANGSLIGVLTLNAEPTLNALTLEMIDMLSASLRLWADDPRVVMVMLQGAGEKAFCAGGDLQNLYRSMLEHHAGGGGKSCSPTPTRPISLPASTGSTTLSTPIRSRYCAGAMASSWAAAWV